MKTAFMIITGVATAMLGVGGVEQSITAVELLQSTAVALVGVAIMAAAVAMIKQEEANEY